MRSALNQPLILPHTHKVLFSLLIWSCNDSDLLIAVDLPQFDGRKVICELRSLLTSFGSPVKELGDLLFTSSTGDDKIMKYPVRNAWTCTQAVPNWLAGHTCNTSGKRAQTIAAGEFTGSYINCKALIKRFLHCIQPHHSLDTEIIVLPWKIVSHWLQDGRTLQRPSPGAAKL